MSDQNEQVLESEGFQYYWCVNCGHHGNFGKRRQRGTNCESCEYPNVTQFELEEILEDETLKSQFESVLNEVSAVSRS